MQMHAKHMYSMMFLLLDVYNSIYIQIQIGIQSQLTWHLFCLNFGSSPTNAKSNNDLWPPQKTCFVEVWFMFQFFLMSFCYVIFFVTMDKCQLTLGTQTWINHMTHMVCCYIYMYTTISFVALLNLSVAIYLRTFRALPTKKLDVFMFINYGAK